MRPLVDWVFVEAKPEDPKVDAFAPRSFSIQASGFRSDCCIIGVTNLLESFPGKASKTEAPETMSKRSWGLDLEFLRRICKNVQLSEDARLWIVELQRCEVTTAGQDVEIPRSDKHRLGLWIPTVGFGAITVVEKGG